MVGCAVSSCKRRSETSNFSKDGVSYHIFPKNPDLREKWTKKCRQSIDWRPSRTSAICSEHFTADSFQALSNNRRKLVPGSIPTLKLSCHCSEEDNRPYSPENYKKSPKSHSNTRTPALRNKETHPKMNMQALIHSKNKKIRRLQTNNKLLREKVDRLKKIIKSYIKNN